MSNRPTAIHKDERTRLHNENGPAFSFADGWCGYYLHGVSVPRSLIETPADDLDIVKYFAKERNAEVRREVLRKVGPLRLQQKLGSVILDQQIVTFPTDAKYLLTEEDNDPPNGPRRSIPPIPNTAAYELHELNLGGTTGPWPYLKMWNPSEECWHMEAVPKECRTVEHALNFRNKGKFIHLAPLS